MAPNSSTLSAPGTVLPPMMKLGVERMSYFCSPSSRGLQHGVLELLVREAGLDLGLAQPAELGQLVQCLDRVGGAGPALLLREEHLDELGRRSGPAQCAMTAAFSAVSSSGKSRRTRRTLPVSM